MEVRAAAQISGDAALSALFERGEDPHRLMAAALNGIEPSAVTSAQRQAAKPVNFGAIYGMGAQGLQQYAWDNYDLVLTKSEAQRQLDSTITSVRPLNNGYFRIVIADKNAVWETTDSSISFDPPRAGQKISILRGPLGSYFLRIDGQVGDRGRRVG